ncbi:hypothetical protein CCACVL1_17585 [Corchorus capsularis]|uniref:Uncharacterized protein n=1 Tax=Corchorus capsularis TaxID=210143 RepID=A0A1R3HQX7_COCAP|nr:hypothetical protein CCACVL1_17585 [Corchorus capsularis]
MPNSLNVPSGVAKLSQRAGPGNRTETTWKGGVATNLSCLGDSAELVEIRSERIDVLHGVRWPQSEVAFAGSTCLSLGKVQCCQAWGKLSCCNGLVYTRYYIELVDWLKSLVGNQGDTPKAYHEGNDAPRTYYGLEDKHGEHGKDVQGLQGSMEMHEDHGDIDDHVPSTKRMPFDPLKMPLGPMTRARAKRFKDALTGLVRTHLEDLKTIEVQLKSFGDDLGKKLQLI